MIHLDFPPLRGTQSGVAATLPPPPRLWRDRLPPHSKCFPGAGLLKNKKGGQNQSKFLSLPPRGKVCRLAIRPPGLGTSPSLRRRHNLKCQRTGYGSVFALLPPSREAPADRSTGRVTQPLRGKNSHLVYIVKTQSEVWEQKRGWSGAPFLAPPTEGFTQREKLVACWF